MNYAYLEQRLSSSSLNHLQLIDKLQPIKLQEHYLYPYLQNIERYIQNGDLSNQLSEFMSYINIDCKSLTIEGPIGIGKTAILKIFTSNQLLVKEGQNIPFSCLLAKEITEKSQQPSATRQLVFTSSQSTIYLEQEKEIIKRKINNNKGSILSQIKCLSPPKSDIGQNKIISQQKQFMVSNFISQLAIDDLQYYNFKDYSNLYKNYKQQNIRYIILSHNSFVYSNFRYLNLNPLKICNLTFTFYKTVKEISQIQEPCQKQYPQKIYHIKETNFSKYNQKQQIFLNESKQELNMDTVDNAIQLNQIFLGNQVIFPSQVLVSFFSYNLNLLQSIRNLQQKYLNTIANYFRFNYLTKIYQNRRSSFPYYIDIRGVLMDIDFWKESYQPQLQCTSSFQRLINQEKPVFMHKNAEDLFVGDINILENSIYDQPEFTISQIISINLGILARRRILFCRLAKFLKFNLNIFSDNLSICHQ